jgi:hypothetical protein
MKTEKFTKDEIAFMCDVINRAGSLDHPCAEAGNLHYFESKYVEKCLIKAHKKLSAIGRALAEKCIAKLHEEVSLSRMLELAMKLNPELNFNEAIKMIKAL